MPADNDDLYSDGPAATATAEAPAEAEAADEGPAEESGDNGDASTGLLPKDFFQGKELTPGKRCEVEIVKSYDDQVSVRYVPHSEEDSEAESPPSEMSPGEGDYE